MFSHHAKFLIKSLFIHLSSTQKGTLLCWESPDKPISCHPIRPAAGSDQWLAAAASLVELCAITPEPKRVPLPVSQLSLLTDLTSRFMTNQFSLVSFTGRKEDMCN